MVQFGFRFLAVTLSFSLLVGCGSGSGKSATPSVEVTQLKATPSRIAPGNTTTLEWASTNATTCTAGGTLPGWSGAKVTGGTKAITPAAAGSYEANLVCRDTQNRTDSASVTVTVTSDVVDITAFNASPANPAPGGSTTLQWTSTNAASCQAQGTLPNWTGTKAASGSESLTNLAAGNYEARLLCTDDQGGADSATVAVSVAPVAPGLSIDSFSADPAEILAGGSTHLTWASTGATGCVAAGSLPGWTGSLQTVDGEAILTITSAGEYIARIICSNAAGASAQLEVTVSVTVPTFDRYALANSCVALKSAANGKYLARSASGYAASAATLDSAEGFYLKPSALGEYLLYNESGSLVTAGLAASNPGGALCTPGQTLCDQPLANAIDSSIFVLKTAGDVTDYPEVPVFDVEPTPAQIEAYRSFADPRPKSSLFTLASKPDGRRLTTGAVDAISLAIAAGDSSTQQFSVEPSLCAAFPEAQNNASGETFKGTTPDGRVLGMADVHVHVVSTTFLGGAKTGAPFHKFGVTHALGSCASPRQHGEGGSRDFLAAAYEEDLDGHATDGWPTFSEWPSKDSLTHESIYWKWLERAWLSGLRILVNDVVENGTLCELERSASNDTSRSCNEMESARRQVGTLYAMQDYIDAQYGGPDRGWFRIVLTPTEAREVIADGKLAVVIGIEISNLFNCQLNYRPTRSKEPFEETGEGGLENAYQCTTTETGAPNEIKTQLDQMWNLGARQIITIHEFDNAFGGNGIFNETVLNLGNRENTGGNPTPGIPPNDPFAFNPLNEIPTGEFWTTYDCPSEAQLAATTPGDGYLWGDAGGSLLTNIGLPPPGCLYTGQGGRHGGTTGCYPATRQCNARWMTPTGLYTYKKLMEKGMIFDIDHLTIDMKTQALELAEAQTPPYPFVSTHGTFGGTTLEQTRRMLANGGHLYPSLGNGPSLLADMKEVRDVYDSAGVPFLFGFGFGTDTNGLSDQASERNSDQIARAGAVVYPYKLFDSGSIFDLVPGLDNDNNPATPYTGVTFKQPEEFDPATGESARTWHIDQDGSAHYGMLSEMVEEVRREILADAGSDPLTTGNTQQMRDLFNSAEVYLQTWERTLAARNGILANDNGGKAKEPATAILRAAPVSP